MAVMKLYLAPGAKLDNTSFETVIDKLRNWREIPKETLMMVRHAWIALRLLPVKSESDATVNFTDSATVPT